jgi:hypothetical protein
METHLADKQILTGWRMAAALLVLAALIAGPIAVVATMANPPPSSELAVAGAYAELQGAGAPIANSVDSGDVGHFAFGYVEFDWDPKAPGGVPGFDSWPPASPRR